MNKLGQTSTVFGALLGVLFALPAHGATVNTSFSTADGFVTGSAAAAVLSKGDLSVTFSGGVQQQFFDMPSYNQGPDAYLVVNGDFNGQTGSSDTATIDFNLGAKAVSFYAANRANGPATTIRALGLDDSTVLGTVSVSQTDIRSAANPELTVFNSSDLGGLIGSIQIDNAGPIGNPPYVTAIDSFSVSAVPIPAALPLFVTGLVALGAWSRRRATNA